MSIRLSSIQFSLVGFLVKEDVTASGCMQHVHNVTLVKLIVMTMHTRISVTLVMLIIMLTITGMDLTPVMLFISYAL